MKKVTKKKVGSKVQAGELAHDPETGEIIEDGPEDVAAMQVRGRKAQDLAAVASMDFDQMAAQAEQIADADLTKKDRLVGVPFVIFSVSRKIGDYGSEFVTVRAVTAKKEVVVFNDGSTGVCAQLQGCDPTPQRGIFCPEGLKCSSYTIPDPEGEGPLEKRAKVPAKTYYLTGSSKVAPLANGATAREARA